MRRRSRLKSGATRRITCSRFGPKRRGRCDPTPRYAPAFRRRAPTTCNLSLMLGRSCWLGKSRAKGAPPFWATIGYRWIDRSMGTERAASPMQAPKMKAKRKQPCFVDPPNAMRPFNLITIHPNCLGSAPLRFETWIWGLEWGLVDAARFWHFATDVSDNAIAAQRRVDSRAVRRYGTGELVEQPNGNPVVAETWV
jgi:hypothetical protein